MRGRLQSGPVRADWRESIDRAILPSDIPHIDLSAADAMIPGEIANAWDDIKTKLLG